MIDGLTSRLEIAMAAHLATITNFKTAQQWKHQVSVNEAGGAEGFQRFAPFAFTAYKPPSDSTREGDGVLNQKLRFGVLIGEYNKVVGQARIDASLLRDLVINTLDSWHPGETFNCDEFKYLDEIEEVDDGHNYALTILFMANQLTIKTTL